MPPEILHSLLWGEDQAVTESFVLLFLVFGGAGD
jgi:hypothetical protein